MTLDRTQAPLYQPIQGVQLPDYQTVTLENGCPLYVVNIGTQPAMKLELVFKAGVWHEQVAGASFFMVKMLSEGTEQHNSAQISAYFDQIGAFLEFNHTSDYTTLVVFGLPKHLETILKMLTEILTEATFPETELQNLKNITSQNLRINQEKNAFQATVQYRTQLFGHVHPYGWAQKEADIEQISRQDLVNYFEQNIKNQPFKAFLSGKISEQEVTVANHYLGQLSVLNSERQSPTFSIKTTSESVYIEKPDALQSSIRMGQFMVLRTEPDFFPFLVCNEVFGGFFGSRLMKNIREDKGFTYGISSSPAILKNTAYFTISTDVKKEYLEATLTEIEKEIEKLQTDLIPNDELEVAKNFMAGQMAGSLNTPFEVADRVKTTILYGLEPTFYDTFIPNLRAATPQQARDIAQRYYKNFVKVVVG